MPFKQITKEMLRTLSPMIAEALNREFKTQGLKFSLGSGRFSDKNATFKLELALVSPDGKVENKARQDYIKLAKVFNCEPEWLDKTFTTCGKTFVVSGLLPNRRTNCVSITNVATKKEHICSPEYVRMYMNMERIATPARRTQKNSAMEATIRQLTERRITEMKRDNPELYYADGEYQASGMTENQIYNHHYTAIEKQVRQEVADYVADGAAEAASS